MTHVLHIPIDDISENDLEADLREVARVAQGDANLQLPPITGSDQHIPTHNGRVEDSYSTKQRSGLGLQPSVHDRFGEDTNQPSANRLQHLDPDIKGEKAPRRNNKVSSSIFDLSRVRQEMEDSRNRLAVDSVRGTGWNTEDVNNNGDNSRKERTRFNDLSQQKADDKPTKDDSVSQKRTFVKALHRKHDEELYRVETTTRLSQDLEELMPDPDELDTKEQDEDYKLETTLKDLSDQKKLEKYEHEKKTDLRGGEIGKEKDGGGIRKNVKHNKDLGGKVDAETNDVEGKRTHFVDNGKSGYKINDERTDYDGMGLTTVKSEVVHRKKGRKHRKHKKVKGKTPILDTNVHNEAVASMVDEQAKAFSNETAEWELVEHKKDRIDIPLTDTGGSWTHKVHGRRDVILAGSIVMVLGVIIIIIGLFSIARSRLAGRKKRRSNANNNKLYRSLGSSSETEILRKPQRSLFQINSSEEEEDDDDDDDDSSSGEEMIYHKKKAFKNF